VWSSRWRSESIGLALVLAVAACSRAPADDRPHVGGEPIDERVIEMVAARDGLGHDEARARVVDTLRWAAAAREAREEAPELEQTRRDHLRRTALARLWLTDVFEPQHRVQDIPADDPLVLRARGQKRFVHPELVEVCQVIAVPSDVEGDAMLPVVNDPRWRIAALERVHAYARHVRRTVALDDPEACDLFTRNARLERTTFAGGKLRIEGPTGFHLDACAELGDDGVCKTAQLAPEWVEVVRRSAVPGWVGPFFTRFGVHFVLVTRVLPAQLDSDPDFLDRIRAAVHDAWRSRELGERLQSLRVERAAQLALPGEDGS